MMATVNVVLSVFLGAKYGAIGSAIGTALSLVLVQGLIINIYLHKKCNIDVIVFWKNILRMLLGLALPSMFGIMLMTFVEFHSIVTLVLAIVLYTLVFFVSMWFLGINAYEKEIIMKFTRKTRKMLKK
jgi:O-antigen/teichoic acid export membrane protein